MLRDYSGQSVPVRIRRALNGLAAVFLLGVALLLISIGKSLWSDPEAVDTRLLVADLDAFEAPLGSRPTPAVVLSECTGEGSYPAEVERRFVVEGSYEAAAAELQAQAIADGWKADPDFPGALVRNDRVLGIGGEDSSGGPMSVIMLVHTVELC